jgi:hypothetical protein
MSAKKGTTLILYTCFAPAISQDSQPKKAKLEKKLQLTSCVLDVDNTLGAYQLTIFNLT